MAISQEKNYYGKDFDVAIVGAGFAGLVAAKSCSEKGIKCIVLEKSPEIGFPIRTSGGTWIETLEHFNVPRSLYNPVFISKFISPNNLAMFNYREPVAAVIDVHGVRQFLAKEALKHGAEIRVATTVKDVIVSEGRVAGVMTNIGPIRAKVVIDASGFDSVIAKKVGLHKGFRRFGVGAEYEIFAPNFDKKQVMFFVGSKFVPSGYGWVFPSVDSMVRVGVGIIYPDEKADPKKRLTQLLNSLEDYGIYAENQIEFHTGIIPSEGLIKKTVADGLIVAGDAAGQPFQLAGEGIRVSMLIGQIAGEVAALAVLNNDYSEKFLSRYETLWRGKFQRNIQISYTINRRISKYKDAEWDKALEFLKKITPEQFYKILRCDFSMSLVMDILRKNPSTISAGLISILKKSLSGAFRK